MTKLNKKSGFSMLELVVVMLIMGTLRGIAISKMGGSDTGAIKASVKSDIRGAIAMINSCYSDTLDFTACVGRDITLASRAQTALTNASYKISLSNGNTGTIVHTTTKNNFPLITITNTMGTTVTTDDYTLYYDADIHSGLSTSATAQVNP